MMLRVLFTTALLSLPGLGHAQPGADELTVADQLAQISERAKVAFESKQYAEAVALYQAAYRLEPVATLLYNIAYICDAHLGDRALARDFYRRYVNAPDADPSARLKAFERIAGFDALDAREAVVAAAIAAPITAAAPVSAAQPASAPRASVPPAPVPPAAISSVTPAVGARVEPAGSSGTLSAVLLSVGGAALLTSGISAVLVSGTHDDYLAARTADKRTDFSESGSRQALVADISLAIGISAVVAGVWVLLTDDDSAKTSWVPAPMSGENGIVFGHAF